MFLHGIRVIDFTRLLPGPYATMRLADLGAEIIKVESPEGDLARQSDPKIGGEGAVYLANNRNKKSIVLDLKSKEGKKQALSLIDEADVIIEGFRPGVMRKLGLDFETVSLRNPRLVYCSLTGYGQTGTLADFAGHDLNYMAVSGFLSQLRDQEGRPITPSVQIGDMVGGILASEAILAGLVQRGRTGEGVYLDVAMTDALAGMLNNHALIQQATGFEHGVTILNGTLVCYGLYQTADGRTISLGALEPKFWHAFCKAVDKPEWIGKQYEPAEDGHAIYEELKALFESRTFIQWMEFGQRVDCCMQPVLNISELLCHSYVQSRNLVVQTKTHPVDNLLQLNTHAGGLQERRK